MNEAFGRYLSTLVQTERMPLPNLARYQEQLLVRLVRHASEHLPFYRERLNCLFTPDGTADLSRWTEVPLLTRDDVVVHGDKMRVSKLPADCGAISEIRSSGSTGAPLNIASNSLVFMSANALLARVARWFNLDPSRPLAAIRRFVYEPPPSSPDGRVRAGWLLSHPETPYYEIELLTPIEQQLTWLARRQPAYLLTQASHALALAHSVAPPEGRALGIEAVVAVGETVPDGARELVAERLGARLIAFYSCQEIGGLACECNAAPHYHVAAESAFIEILDDQGRDVAPGERGRVVVTGFYNYAMPFIRYVLGDVAVAGKGPCVCGRGLPVIEQVLGRSNAAFLFRDGTRVWLRGSLVRAMRIFVPFSRFQLVQRDYENIEFRYVPDGSGRKPDIAALNAHARKVIHPSVIMSVTKVDQLRPGPSGKLDEFVSLDASSVPRDGPSAW
jgi:phenylacetate-CoA ligase